MSSFPIAPEEFQQYGAPSRQSGTYGSLGGIDASIQTPRGNKFGLEYTPQQRQIMLRAEFPF